MRVDSLLPIERASRLPDVATRNVVKKREAWMKRLRRARRHCPPGKTDYLALRRVRIWVPRLRHGSSVRRRRRQRPAGRWSIASSLRSAHATSGLCVKVKPGLSHRKSALTTL